MKILDRFRGYLLKIFGKIDPVLIADLKELRILLAEPKAFAKKSLARDTYGYRIDPLHREAVSFCLMGGGVRVTGSMRNPRYFEIMKSLRKAVPWLYAPILLPDFSDQSSHAEILTLIDRALIRAGA